MKIRRNKKGFYTEDKDDFYKQLSICVALALIAFTFAAHLIRIIFF